ncbi:trypsin-like serine protease [Amycolatopsis sp. NPDC059020]|uniref:trypsin-like serine protease n=1 Tax=unclassified Amycolatopsis TaxID=2618356 RepID=UPI00366CB487
MPGFRRWGAVLAAVILVATATVPASADPAIVGGRPAAPDQFPYQLSLWGDGAFQCGASLVDRDIVLTAAHCVVRYNGDASRVVIRHGSNRLDGGTPVAVKKIVAHKQFNPDSYFNDIALLKLASAMTYDAHTRPVTLAPANQVVRVGETLTLSGWGKTSYPGDNPNDLQTIGLKALDLQTCATRLSSKGPVSTASLCTTSPEGQGACKGDSGGPLVTAAGTQVGIVSWGVHCALGYPDVFTSVGSFSDWIRAKRLELGTTCVPTAPIFAVNDDVLLYGHPAATDGGPMAPDRTVIGNGGWAAFTRVVAGPDGVLYGVRANGDVYRYRWTGTGWSDDSRKLVATGWTGFDTDATRNRITVDASGDFYLVAPDGKLSRRSYQPALGTWSSETIGAGWNAYDLITGAGKGVLYARTPGGLLYRFTYDTATKRWTQTEKLVGNGGWNTFRRISSAGGDVLYAVTGNGDLRWYRYLPYSDTWDDGPVTIGNGGWQQFTDVEIQRNACTLPT